MVSLFHLFGYNHISDIYGAEGGICIGRPTHEELCTRCPELMAEIEELKEEIESLKKDVEKMQPYYIVAKINGKVTDVEVL